LVRGAGRMRWLGPITRGMHEPCMLCGLHRGPDQTGPRPVPHYPATLCPGAVRCYPRCRCRSARA
jgi:hypothetical protein